LDTREDLELLREVFNSFGGRDDFSWLEVLQLMEARPDLVAINARVNAKRLTDIDRRTDG
jgi:spore coat polysaccharide biosynthesis protein SpsF (cytidylyltransferase family)